MCYFYNTRVKRRLRSHGLSRRLEETEITKIFWINVFVFFEFLVPS